MQLWITDHFRFYLQCCKNCCKICKTYNCCCVGQLMYWQCKVSCVSWTPADPLDHWQAGQLANTLPPPPLPPVSSKGGPRVVSPSQWALAYHQYPGNMTRYYCHTWDTYNVLQQYQWPQILHDNTKLLSCCQSIISNNKQTFWPLPRFGLYQNL